MEESTNCKQVSEKEIMVRENRIFIDEENIINNVANGGSDQEKALRIKDAIHKLAEQVPGPVRVLFDLTNSERPTPSARKIFLSIPEEEGVSKLAMFGGNPVSRVIGTFILRFNRQNNMKFFKSRESAKSWLLE